MNYERFGLPQIQKLPLASVLLVVAVELHCAIEGLSVRPFVCLKIDKHQVTFIFIYNLLYS